MRCAIRQKEAQDKVRIPVLSKAAPLSAEGPGGANNAMISCIIIDIVGIVGLNDLMSRVIVHVAHDVQLFQSRDSFVAHCLKLSKPLLSTHWQWRPASGIGQLL